MVRRAYPGYRCRGRFWGRRVDCESVPCLPASAVSRYFSDPRRIPYLLVWEDPHSGAVREAVRIAAYSEPGNLDWRNWVEITRRDGSHTVIRSIQRPMPRNESRTRFLACPGCFAIRRALYGWKLDRTRSHSVYTSLWQCRECAELRHTSEGGALVLRTRCAMNKQLFARIGSLPRPQPWYPHVFSSPHDAAEVGLCTLGDAA
jgi:hypothetical protein